MHIGIATTKFGFSKFLAIAGYNLFTNWINKVVLQTHELLKILKLSLTIHHIRLSDKT